MTNNPEPSISPAAVRMRRHRKLRREGLRCLMIQLRETEIEALIYRGLLKPEMRNWGRCGGPLSGKSAQRDTSSKLNCTIRHSHSKSGFHGPRVIWAAGVPGCIARIAKSGSQSS